MEQVFEFIGNHPILAGSFIAILVAIIVVELRRLGSGGRDIEPGEATQLYNKNNAVFIDLRSENDFRKSHLPGAVSAPGSLLDQRLSKLERYKNQPVIVYCDSGLQSGKPAARLRKEGFEQVHQLKGGMQAWLGAGFPVESK